MREHKYSASEPQLGCCPQRGSCVRLKQDQEPQSQQQVLRVYQRLELAESKARSMGLLAWHVNSFDAKRLQVGAAPYPVSSLFV
jgi:hypothetical protein